jgi:hypothetical protein
MFLVDRSAFAVLVPLAMLAAVVFWSNQSKPQASAQSDTPSLEQDQSLATEPRNQTVAANLPSR